MEAYEPMNKQEEEYKHRIRINPLELFLTNLKLKNEYYTFYLRNNVRRLNDALVFNQFPSNMTKLDEIKFKILIANIRAIRDHLPENEDDQVEYLDKYQISFEENHNVTTEQMMKGFKPKSSKPNYCLPKQFQSQNITPSTIFSVSLQAKKMSHISPLENFQNLLQLYLNDNQLTSIENLIFPSLEILDLSDNYIRRIEGMENIPCLKEISLEKNIITVLEGFRNNGFLQSINVSNQSLPKGRGLMIDPECVLAQENMVTAVHMENCGVIDPTYLMQFPFLKRLSVKDNGIEDMMSFLAVLKVCIGIEWIDVRNNPFTMINKTTYKNFIVLSLRNIIDLDGKTVTDNEKAYVNNLFIRKYGGKTKQGNGGGNANSDNSKTKLSNPNIAMSIKPVKGVPNHFHKK